MENERDRDCVSGLLLQTLLFWSGHGDGEVLGLWKLNG